MASSKFDLVRWIVQALFGNWLRRLGVSFILLGLSGVFYDTLFDALVKWAFEKTTGDELDFNPSAQFILSIAVVASGVLLILVSYQLEQRNRAPTIFLRKNNNFVTIEESTRDLKTPTSLVSINLEISTNAEPITLARVQCHRRSQYRNWSFLRGIGWKHLPNRKSGDIDFKLYQDGRIRPLFQIEPTSRSEIGIELQFWPPDQLIQTSHAGNLDDGPIVNADAEMDIQLDTLLESEPVLVAKNFWSVRHNPRSGTFDVISQSRELRRRT